VWVPDPGDLSPSAIRREFRGPVPPVVPDDFTVILGAVMSGESMRGLEEDMEALGGLRGQVMAVAAAMAGEP